jgi:hypothetical protein
MNEELNNENVKVAEPVQTDFEPLPEPPKKKRKGKGFLIFLIVVLIIGGLIFGGIKLFKYLTRIDDPFPDIDALGTPGAKTSEISEYTLTSLEQIDEDYKNGSITADQYIMQLAYATYDINSMDERYKSLDYDFIDTEQLFSKASEVIDELSENTINYLVEKYSLSDMKWNVDISEDDTSYLNDYKVKNVWSPVGDDTNKVDHVKLSSKGHFLVYYTTTGRNAVSDEHANKIANFLEKMVVEYEKKYGLKYQYSPTNFRSANSVTYEVTKDCKSFNAEGRAACQILKDSGVDTDYLLTAMPVYIVDLSQTDLLGAYNAVVEKWRQILTKAGRNTSSFNDLDSNLQMQVSAVAGTYTFPYFMITSASSNFEDTELVAAHELFHHYQHYFCGTENPSKIPEAPKGYGDCPSGGFTIETTATLFAVDSAGVNKTGTAFNKKAYGYNLYSYKSLNKGSGYNQFVFLSNYENMVKNGTRIALDSLKQEDALKYLKNKAGAEKFKEVMLKTAEKMLTLDYDNKVLIATDENGVIKYPVNNLAGKQEKNRTSNYASINFFYATPSDHGEKAQIIADSESKHLTLLVFIKSDGKYEKVYTHELTKDFVMNLNDFIDYDELAFAVVDSSATGTHMYHFYLEEESDREPTFTPETIGRDAKRKLKARDNSIMCYQIEDSEMFKTVYQVKVDFNKEEKISEMYVKGTIRMKNYDPNNPAFNIAKRVVNGLIFAMRLQYKEKLKSVKISTTETDDTYTLLFKVKDNFDQAFGNNFESVPTSKEDAINIITSKGFICE